MIPDQRPERRRQSLRPRHDPYTVPTFRVTPRRLYVEPTEQYDPANEPRPFEWEELADPKLVWCAGLAVALGVIALIVVLASGPMPS